MLSFHTFDVFTRRPFSGNPLAIVEGADSLTTAQMQSLAREFNLSETIFVQTPHDPDNTAKVRIFFPTAEIPFAGHPTIGCAIHLAVQGAQMGDFETEIRLEEQAGLVPVRVVRRGTRIDAEFVAPVLPAPQPGKIDPAVAAEALGLSEAQIGYRGHRPAFWRAGPAFAFVPLVNRAALRGARPMEPYWSAMLAEGGVDSAYVYTPGEGCDFFARMFSPTAGIPEDPATGSASAILAAQLLASGMLGNGESRLALEQGVEMGRPSEIGLTARVKDGALVEIRISGSAVPISSGRIAIPEATR